MFDDTGMSTVGLMVEKMPHIAVEGLNQFYSVDVAFRKGTFYLNYLEGNPKSTHLHEDEDEDFNEGEYKKEELKRLKHLVCPTTALRVRLIFIIC